MTSFVLQKWAGLAGRLQMLFFLKNAILAFTFCMKGRKSFVISMSFYDPCVAESLFNISKSKIPEKNNLLSPNTTFQGGHIAKLAILSRPKNYASNRFTAKDVLALQEPPLAYSEPETPQVRLLHIGQEVESEKVRI